MAKRDGRVYGVAVVLLLLVGCGGTREFDWTGSAFQLAGGHDRIVVGSLENVTAAAETLLKEKEFYTTKTGDATTVRLNVVNKTGVHFTLVLTRHRGDHGEVTNVRCDWDDNRNAELEMQILDQVEVRGKG